MTPTKPSSVPRGVALSGDPEFLAIIERARAEFAAGKTRSLEEVKRSVLPRRSPGRRKQSAERKAPRSN